MELQKVIQGVADNNNQQTFKEISHNKLIRNKTFTSIIYLKIRNLTNCFNDNVDDYKVK
jgi:hypothetical protein